MAKRKSKVPLEVISLEDDGFHLFVKCRIGRVKARFLVDTGASKTVVDKNFLSAHYSDIELMQNEKLGTSASDNDLQHEIALLPKLSVGDAQSEKFYVAVMDINHINETYKSIQLPSIQGVLGCDFLVAHKGVLNLRKQYLSFKKNGRIPK